MSWCHRVQLCLFWTPLICNVNLHSCAQDSHQHHHPPGDPSGSAAHAALLLGPRSNATPKTLLTLTANIRRQRKQRQQQPQPQSQSQQPNTTTTNTNTNTRITRTRKKFVLSLFIARYWQKCKAVAWVKPASSAARRSERMFWPCHSQLSQKGSAQCYPIKKESNTPLQRCGFF